MCPLFRPQACEGREELEPPTEPQNRAPQRLWLQFRVSLRLGRSRSLFGRGYDPMEQKPRAPIAFHYDKWACKKTGSGCSNVWTDPQWHAIRASDEVQIFHTAAAHTVIRSSVRTTEIKNTGPSHSTSSTWAYSAFLTLR